MRAKNLQTERQVKVQLRTEAGVLGRLWERGGVDGLDGREGRFVSESEGSEGSELAREKLHVQGGWQGGPLRSNQ